MAFDMLRQRHSEQQAVKEYLSNLHLAVQESESHLDGALRVRLASEEALTSARVSCFFYMRSTKSPVRRM